jgi:hypothetical protein
MQGVPKSVFALFDQVAAWHERCEGLIGLNTRHLSARHWGLPASRLHNISQAYKCVYWQKPHCTLDRIIKKKKKDESSHALRCKKTCVVIKRHNFKQEQKIYA